MFIATRSALRVLPIAVDRFQFTDWSRDRDLTSVPIWRNLLISSVAGQMPTDDMKVKATAAAATAATDAAAVIWEAVRADCQLWVDHAAPDGTSGIDVAPLDLKGTKLKPDWARVREKLLDDSDPDRGADWSFWIDWYDTILRGDPQDWDLLYEIAVSDDIDWEARPRLVNESIARIVEKHRLLREIADLKAQRDQLALFTASAEARSHNMPPELVDDYVHVAQSIQIIWEQLDAAEDELLGEAPEPWRLAKIGQAIVDAAVVVLKYCGQKADIMITEGVKKVGAAGGIAAAGLLASQTEAAREIGHGLIEFAKLLIGG